MSKNKVARTFDYTGVESFVIKNGNEPAQDRRRWYDVETATDADGNEYHVIKNGDDPERSR